MNTLIVSGGAGFIGTALAKRLSAVPDIRLVLIDNLHPQVHPGKAWPQMVALDLHRILGDVTDLDPWFRALDLVEGDLQVVHLAAETGTGQSLTEARRHAGVNVLGTAAMTDALTARRIRPRSIMLTSSRAVYGEGQWLDADGRPLLADPRRPNRLDAGEWRPYHGDIPLVEPLPHRAEVVEPRPSNIYAATKLAQEHLLAAWAAAMSIDLTILRLQNVYGAGQALENSYTGVLTYFARQVLSGGVIDVYEEGEILRDFVAVEDVVNAITSALEGDGYGVRRFDIGSGAPQSLFTVAALLAEAAGAAAPRRTARYRPGDVRAAWADITDAERALGYRPAVTLQEGLGSLLDYARAELQRVGRLERRAVPTSAAEA